MVIVTGGLGLIGSRIVSRLNSKDTIIVDDVTEEKLQNVKNCLYKKIISVREFQSNMFDFDDIEYIFHEGAISSTTETNEKLISNNNIEFTKQLIDFAVKHNILISYASSASVYGSSQTFSESDQLDPKSLYAKSKAEVDAYVTKLLELNPDLKIQGYRYFNVYGKNEKHKNNQASPIFKFKSQLEKENKITLFKDSSTYLRDFVYVEDIVDIKLRLIKENVSGIFNIGTGNAVSFEHIADLFIKKYGGQIDYIDMPANLINQYQKYTCADMSKLLEVIDYKFTSVDQYINELSS